MTEILQYLKKRGECLDTDIISATGMPYAEVHRQLSELKANNQVIVCQLTKYVKGKKILATICRISGYIPPAKPGAKPRVWITL